MGSAVDKQNLTALLQQYHDAGIGGVEICPIYGVLGEENKYIPFLSPKWMDMLAWTSTEAQRLGMGMDLTTGTGWPMGGPEPSIDDASSSSVSQRFTVAGGSEFKQDLGVIQRRGGGSVDPPHRDRARPQRRVHQRRAAGNAAEHQHEGSMPRRVQR